MLNDITKNPPPIPQIMDIFRNSTLKWPILKTLLCAKCGSIAFYTLRNKANEIFFYQYFDNTFQYARNIHRYNMRYTAKQNFLTLSLQRVT